MLSTIIFAILFFSLIILVHEAGHLLTAKLFHVQVHEFAIGMGPKLFSKQLGETRYSVRAIPVGGFCSMEGEDEASDSDGSFSAKPWYQKLVILAAGAGMNILLGFVICFIFVCVSASTNGGIATTTVDTVMEESALYGQILPGDEIISINDKSVNIRKDINFIMQDCSGKESHVTVRRGKAKHTFSFKPIEAQYSDGSPAYLVGFTAKIEKANLLNLLHESYFQTVWMGKVVFVSLGMMLKGDVSLNEVSGPVGVVDAMNTTAQTGGFFNLLYLAAFISVNIGLMNLLPIPALDGGRIFFVIIEAIRRKPIPPEKEGFVHFIGLVLLLGIMVFATWNDISRIISQHMGG